MTGILEATTVTLESKNLRKMLRDLPDAGGVYVFKKGEQTLYVGKSKRLRERLQHQHFTWILSLVDLGEMDSLVIYRCDDEKKAARAERGLIRELSPAYNSVFNKELMEDTRRRQTYWLSDEEIRMVEQLAEVTGSSKYEVVAAAIQELHRKVSGDVLGDN